MVKRFKKILQESETSNFYYLLIGLLALMSILFVMGDEGGLPAILGRMIGFMIIILFSYNLIEWTSNVTSETIGWTKKESLDEDINLRIKDISELLKRASEGKEKSQEILHKRLKKIFFLKLKEIKDLSDQDLRELVRKPEEFHEVVKDEVIADFILSIEEEQNKTKTGRFKLLSSSNGNRQKKYKNKIKDIIRRIDEWEERYHG